MKKRNILIVYVNYGDITTISKRERTFKKVLEQMTDSGLKLTEMSKDSREQHAVFSDGSKVSMVSFGVMTRGNRFTHMYIDKEAMSVSNGEQYISQILLPQMMTAINSEETYEVALPVHERIQFFEFDNKHKLTFSGFTRK